MIGFLPFWKRKEFPSAQMQIYIINLYSTLIPVYMSASESSVLVMLCLMTGAAHDVRSEC